MCNLIHSGPLLSYEFTTLAPKWKHVDGQAMLPHRHGCDRQNRWKMYVADITVAVILCKYSRRRKLVHCSTMRKNEENKLLSKYHLMYTTFEKHQIKTETSVSIPLFHKLQYAPLMSKVVFQQEGHAIVTDAIAIYACVAVLGFKDMYLYMS